MRIPDTTFEQACRLEPIHVNGLYFIYKGERLTPTNIYFSSDMRDWWSDPTQVHGRAYTHFDNALRPVLDTSGKQYRVTSLSGVTGFYRDGVISRFTI